MVCNASYVHVRYLREKNFGKEMAAYIKTTYNRSNCQLTSNREKLPTAVVLCRTRSVSQNLTRPITTEPETMAMAAAEIIEEHKMTVLMFDETPKLRSMATYPFSQQRSLWILYKHRQLWEHLHNYHEFILMSEIA